MALCVKLKEILSTIESVASDLNISLSVGTVYVLGFMCSQLCFEMTSISDFELCM